MNSLRFGLRLRALLEFLSARGTIANRFGVIPRFTVVAHVPAVDVSKESLTAALTRPVWIFHLVEYIHGADKYFSYDILFFVTVISVRGTLSQFVRQVVVYECSATVSGSPERRAHSALEVVIGVIL